ncbi:hypothetical protein [Sporosarcina sp. BP05]|uniref:hypothetical protein n=1 Tax=Sporosarcina sp. BP05 TaxID=2758726 RepID=UPI001645754F|nr:hypothetical protein [Sporosarcina sp. BP05]
MAEKEEVIVTRLPMGGGYFFLDNKKITDKVTDINAIYSLDSEMKKLSISYVVIGLHFFSF